MAIPGQIKRYQWVWQGETYKLFAKDGQLDGIVSGLQDQGLVNRAPQTFTVPGHTRRRYPGGPAISVPQVTRTTLVGGEATRATLPGQNAYIEIENSTGGGSSVQVITIRFTGPYTALYQFMLANHDTTFNLRSPDGTIDVIGTEASE